MMKFKVGIWYLYNHSDQPYYFKCGKEDIDVIHYSEFINPVAKTHSPNGSSFNNEFVTDVEISLEEIQEYLPANHPDRKSNKVDTTDYKYLTPLLKKLNIT